MTSGEGEAKLADAQDEKYASSKAELPPGAVVGALLSAREQLASALAPHIDGAFEVRFRGLEAGRVEAVVARAGHATDGELHTGTISASWCPGTW